MWVANGCCKRVSDLLCTISCIGQPASCRPSPKIRAEASSPFAGPEATLRMTGNNLPPFWAVARPLCPEFGPALQVPQHTPQFPPKSPSVCVPVYKLYTPRPPERSGVSGPGLGALSYGTHMCGTTKHLRNPPNPEARARSIVPLGHYQPLLNC